MKILKKCTVLLLVFGFLMRPTEVLAQENGVDRAGSLMIDHQNLYEGMEKTYSEGYVPKVENGRVYLVVPLLSERTLEGDSLYAALNLGDSEKNPFICKNYAKRIPFQKTEVNGGADTVEGYLASFELELKEERCNGSYPVILSVKATDETCGLVEKDFTIYVTISDGKKAADDSDADGQKTADDTDSAGVSTSDVTQTSGSFEGTEFAPKLVVQSCRFSSERIEAGSEIRADITLFNTSKTETIRNMTIVSSAQGEYFNLLSQSDTIYVDSLQPEKTYVASYIYRINTATPQGQYELELSLDYANSKGAGYNCTGKVRVPVEQPMRVLFDPLIMSEEVQVGDVVEAQIQAMNLGRGKVYNVRAVLEADGLKPNGTIFIGDMEAGTTASASTSVSVSGLSEEDTLYGTTEGKVTFCYEDENGTEYEESAVFTTTVRSPFSDRTEAAEDEPGQWWIIMAVIGSALCVLIVFTVVRRIRRRKQRDEMVE